MQRRCHHGRVVGVEAAQSLGQLIPCLGDGACFWYAASHGGQQPSTWHPQQAAELKERVLNLLRQHPAVIASWLGSGPDLAASILEDWQSWDSWADGRALAITSLLQDVTLLIVNQKEQALELYTPAQSVDLIGETWALSFNKDHYDYICIEDIACLHAILDSFTLAPLHTRAGHDHSSLRGGAWIAEPATTHSARLLKAGHTSIVHKHVTEACDRGAICCRSFNVGGLRHHTDELVTHCIRDRVILGIQETGVARQAQRSLDSTFRREGLAVNWGTPSPISKNACGAWRTDRRVPGVAFVHSSDLPLYAVQMRTEKARSSAAHGRLLMAALPSHSGSLRYLLNLYAPSGAQQRDARAQFYNDLLCEIAAWPDTSLALLGDFQAELEDLPFYLDLSTMGWRKVLSYSCEGTLHPHTYRSGSVTSTIDHILLSPCFDDTTQHLVVEEVPGFQHCMLTCALQVEPQQAYPRIAYPPKLHFPNEPARMPHLWEEAQGRIQALLCSHSEDKRHEWDQCESVIDQAWGIFEETLRYQLTTDGSSAKHASGEPATMQALGDVSRHWKHVKHRKGYHDRHDRIAHQAVAWPVRKAL